MSTRFLSSMILLLASVSVLVSGSLAALPPPEGSYNIMMLLPFGSQSHRNCFFPLAESLVDRGHQVTILSALPPRSKHPNITEINHGINIMGEDLNTSLFELRETDPVGAFRIFEHVLPKLARELYINPDVKKLYDRRKDFDIFILDAMFNEPSYPFLDGSNYIAIATGGIEHVSSATLGNVLNPSYIPTVITDFERPYSMVERMKNVLFHLAMPIFWRKWAIFPRVQKELIKHFPTLPSLEEIEKRCSLVLINSHFSLDISMPILPSQVEVGGMHCRPGKKLPKYLESFIEGSGPEGVIYFSLGSVCQGNTIPNKFKTVLIDAFKRLNFGVIWKFEDEFKDLPKNVMVDKWLPQQDILAHPKVKLFITHGGLLSMQEAIYHGTPLLALPVFGDQERNAQRIQTKGFGKFLIWEDLTPELLISTIQEIVNNPKYKKQIDFVSKSFKDQPSPPLEKAVWWTEYVIRHKGAPQLKSPGADLSWIEYLMIDVIVVVHIIMFLTVWILRKLFSLIKTAITKPSSPKGRKSKKE